MSEQENPALRHFIFPDIEEVWANGIDFDLPILSNLINDCGHHVPWHFYRKCDMRTIRWLSKDAFRQEMPRLDNPHNAALDAMQQARRVQAILAGVPTTAQDHPAN